MPTPSRKQLLAVFIRTYYRVPSHHDRELGSIFQEYLLESMA